LVGSISQFSRLGDTLMCALLVHSDDSNAFVALMPAPPQDFLTMRV
jgi:hypothetical protein